MDFMDENFDIKFDIMDDAEIKKTVDELMKQYDEENKGFLTKEECRKLFKEFIGVDESGQEITDEIFDKMFPVIDSNNSGNIEKEELYDYIKNFINKH